MFQKIKSSHQRRSKSYKIIIANIIFKFATRLFYVFKVIISLLIKLSLCFNPKRVLFWKSLAEIDVQYSLVLHKNKSFSYDSIIDNHTEITKDYKEIYGSKDISLTMPIVTPKIELSPEYECRAKLPATYLATINNAQVFASTDLIIVNDKVYYDEIDPDHLDLYAIKSPNIKKITKTGVDLKIPRGFCKKIKKGIHLTKDHSKNYFHWIIEVLPRLSLIDGIDKDVPILVSHDLPSQFYDALNIINKENRRIIKLRTNKNYLVETLYYPSRLSIINDNYNQPIYNKDAIYSPDGIKFIRDSVLKSLNCSGKKGKRRLFISRSGSNYRQLLNSNEIEELLIGKGFEIVFPENLSFNSQVQLFSEAEIIIGQSGAGMANFIFAPLDCKVIIIMSDVVENNFHLFNALAIASNISIEFFIGKRISSISKYTIHADFNINQKEFIQFFDKKLEKNV